MKKHLATFGIVGILLVNNAFADGIIFNNGSREMQISYRICYPMGSFWDGDHSRIPCGPIKTINLNNKNEKNIQNKIIFNEKVEKPYKDAYQGAAFLEIINAVEMDGGGNKIAYGKFQDENRKISDTYGSGCGILLQYKEEQQKPLKHSIAILDDLNGSDTIVCQMANDNWI